MGDNSQTVVLVVDDKRENIYILKMYLESAGYKVLEAENGADAVEIATMKNPHLILLDVELPDFSGYEVCEALKLYQETRGIPVIFVTADNQQNNQIKGLEIGAVDYIIKPVLEKILLPKVKTFSNMRKKEIALQEYADKLEQSNRELQNFANVAAHDLQEPLRKVQVYGSRLQSSSKELSGRSQQYLDRMISSTKRMKELVHDLLIFCRMASTQKISKEVELDQVIQDILNDYEIYIEELGAQVEIFELPVLEGDRVRIRQLFQNLISNSLKFHRENVAPKLKIKSSYDPKQEIHHIRVEDNGIGFEEKYLDRIFTPFERLHANDQYEGTGIGLAICRKAVEQHNGFITAESIPGEGATFIVALPSKIVLK